MHPIAAPSSHRTPGITWRRGVAGFGVTALLGLVGIVATGGPASAHANLLETTPAAEAILEDGPASVDLRFTEAVQASDGGVSVFGPDGGRVDRGSIDRLEGGVLLRVPVDTKTEGTYTVSWRVTSDDAHTISGAFVFHVGRVTGAVEIDDSTPASVVVGGYLGRWVVFAGSLVALGALVVRLLLGADTEGRRRMQRLAFVAAVAATGGAVVSLVAAAAEAGGRGLVGGLWLTGDFVSEQRTGTLLALRAGALLALVSVLALGRVWRKAPVVVLAPIVAALLTTSLAGHAWTTSTRGAAVVLDLVHQVAVGIWVGGAVAVMVALARVAEPQRLARRFSNTALVTVGVVALTGSISGWIQLRSIEALLWTGYGQRLMLKVLGFTVLVYIGWWNRTKLVGFVDRSVEPLRRSLRVEWAVGAVVLALTTSLVVQPPGRLTLAQPFDSTVVEQALTLEIAVDPGRAGANDIHLYFFGEDGVSPVTIDAVEIQASTASLPPRRLTVTPVTPSHVSALGASLPSPGTWTLEISAVQAGTVTPFTIEVPIR